jgi:hypothetical protein
LVGASVTDAAVPVASVRLLVPSLVATLLTLPGVALPLSVPLEVLRPKPCRGKAWCPICI